VFRQHGASQAIHIKDLSPGQDTSTLYRELTAAVR